MKFAWRIITAALVILAALVLPAAAINSNFGGVPWNSTGGGCWTYSAAGYTYMMWNTTGVKSWTVPTGVTSVSAIVIAGGGGGGGAPTGSSGAGGGGAGGVDTPGPISVTEGATLNVTVGSGGTGGTKTGGGGGSDAGKNGTASRFDSYTQQGGGGGGSSSNGMPGASGGGGSNGYNGASPLGAYGNSGGNGAGATTYPGGGGGGRLSGGTNGVSGTGGSGGNGYTVTLGVLNETVAGGGGGATDSGTAGAAGTGGGGTGGVGSTLPTAGANGWGAGGGGADSVANAVGAAGGSGAVIIQYVTPGTIIVSFTANTTTGYVSPYPVLVSDTSTGSPDSFNWTWGDGRSTNLTTNVSTLYQYSVAGSYNVGHTAKNTGASTVNSTTYTNFINLTTDVDTYVKSWMHMNGSAGGTTFTDIQGNAWTANGATTVASTAAFLGSAGSFAVNDARISSPSSTVWDFGKGTFETEFWINVSSIGDANKPVVQRSTGGSGFGDGWGFFNLNATVNGWAFWWGNGAVNHTAGVNIPLNTRTHIVISRNASGYVNIAKNGVWQTASNMGNGVYDVAQPMVIGAFGGGTETTFLMDEFRLSVGHERWPANLQFTTPYTYYKGNLFQGASNVNPNATLRYKTDPGTPQSEFNTLFNGTPRSRTVQIQNISSASSISFGLIYDTLHESVGVPVPNTTTYADMQVNSYSVDTTNGIVFVTASRVSGSPIVSLLSNRTSIVNVPINYINYTTDNTFNTFFTNASIYNSVGPSTYPITNFILTEIYYGTWPTPNVAFSADNVTPVFGQTVTFTGTSLAGYPNGFNYSFGDGQYTNSSSLVATHAYATTGLKTVSLTAFQNANASITNTTTYTNYINVQASSGPIPAFTANRSYSITSPINVRFNITDSTPFVTSWNWSYGDGTWGNYTVKDQANATHTYNNYGAYQVSLYETNNAGTGVTTKATGVVLSVSNVTASSPTIGKLLTGTQLIQLQNVTNVDGVAMNITFNATSLRLQGVSLNASAGTGVTLSSQSIDNTNGLASFGLSGTGFSYSSTNTTVLDLLWLAQGITNNTEPINFNATTGKNFITTNLSTYTADRTVAFTNKNPGLITFTNNTFTKMITVINLNTQLAISGALVTYSYTGPISGSGTTNTGMFNITSTAGDVTVVTSAPGYYNGTQTYSFTDNNAETLVMTPLSGPANPQTWFAPKPATFFFRNANTMQPMTDLKITAVFNTTTLPATGTSWLYTMYGMNAAAAAQALLPGLYMNGTTDSLGQIVFTMQPSISYNVQATDSNGTINNYMITPRENGIYYLQFTPVTATVDNYYADIVASGNTWSRPYVNPNDLNNFTAMFSFQDLTSYTTKVDFIITDMNGTILHITNQTNPIAGGIYVVNFTLTNVRGNQINVYQNITRSV